MFCSFCTTLPILGSKHQNSEQYNGEPFYACECATAVKHQQKKKKNRTKKLSVGVCACVCLNDIFKWQVPYSRSHALSLSPIAS